MSLQDKLFDGEVKIPGVGPVKKKVLIPIAAGAAAFIAWRYYQASTVDSADATPADSTDASGYADDGTIPAVDGTSDGSYGYGDPVVTDPTTTTPVTTTPVTTDPGTGTTDPGSGSGDGDTGGGTVIPDPGSYGFNGTTNSQWVQYAATQLSGQGTWTYQAIVSALGAYLASSPLTTLQQQQVQAAIAVAGNPPVGSYHLISGGNTAMTVAPTGLKVTTTDTSAHLTFNKVAGAGSYRAYDNKSATNIGASNDTSITVGGLVPSTTYIFHVRAFSQSGSQGPASATVTVKTKAKAAAAKPPATKAAPAKAPAKPAKPTVSAIGQTGAHAATGNVTGATGYTWFINGASAGHTSGPTHTISGLHKGTAYKLTVEALNKDNVRSAQSTATSFTTKK